MKAATPQSQVFVYGDNSFGQLGVTSNQNDQNHQTPQRILNIPELTPITFEFKINKVKCGKDNTGFITEEGFLFIMGSNKHGKLGVGLNHE